MALLKADNLTKEYDGRPILKDISLEIQGGEAFAIIGPTGTGKTTLLRLLDLLEVPTSGDIYFDGINVTKNQRLQLEARRRISYVQQKPMMFTMSVYDNVACVLKWRRGKSDIIRQKVENALELVEMTDYRNRNAKTLSGGETQRIAIARALVTEPEVLFLDEPTANLDPLSTLKIEQTIANVSQERKTAVIMATHDMVQGQQLANRIGVLLEGRMMQIGSPSDIFYSPESPEVAGFVGIENVLPGTVTGKDEDLVTVEVNGHSIQAISGHGVGDKVSVLIRPEDITFSLTREPSSARNTLSGKITRLTPIGTLTRIEVHCGFPLLGVVTRSSAQDMNLAVGKNINASFKATATHVINRWQR